MESKDQYTLACEAAEDRFKPLTNALQDEGFDTSVEQTGGMVFVLYAKRPGRTGFFGVSDDLLNEVLVCYYEHEEDEGAVVAYDLFPEDGVERAVSAVLRKEKENAHA